MKTKTPAAKDPRLSKNVRLLGVVSFLTDLSSEMIFPLLPLFLVNVLKADMSVVGLIDGVAESTADVGKMLSGWYSDKIKKRKPFMVAGYGLSTFTKPFFALAASWHHVLAVRFLDRVGKGLRGTARDAMVAEETTTQTRGKAFGYRKMMDQLGAVLGPLAAFLLMPYLTTATGSTEGAYRTIFWLSFIPGLLSVAMLYLIKEKAAKMQREKKTSFSKALGPQFKRFLIVTVVFGLGMFSYSFMILRAQEVGVNVNLIPLLYLSFNVSYMFFAMPFGTHSDKIGRKRVLAMGYISFALLSAGLIYSKTTFHVWTMFMLYGLFMAIMETVQRAYISDVVKAEVRGTAFGLHQGATGFAALPANLIAGTLWSMYGSAAAFTYSITVTAAALVLLAATVEEKRS